jgi:GAF domain-containing protein
MVMKAAPLSLNESARLQSLNEHELLDTLPEAVYDDITKIASEITQAPIALITLVDDDRQWFKSKQGMVARETPREYSFCAHAIVAPDEVFIVPDARIDERFHDNPQVIGDPSIVFYAGVPVKDTEGNAMGTLCIIDKQPRELSEQQIESLKALAKLVNAHFELRKTRMDLDKAQDDLQMVQSLVNTMQDDIKDLIKSNPKAEQVQQLTAALKLTVDALKNISPISR